MKESRESEMKQIEINRITICQINQTLKQPKNSPSSRERYDLSKLIQN